MIFRISDAYYFPVSRMCASGLVVFRISDAYYFPTSRKFASKLEIFEFPDAPERIIRGIEEYLRHASISKDKFSVIIPAK